MSATNTLNNPLLVPVQKIMPPSELVRRQLMLDHPLVRGAPIMTPPAVRAATACKITFFEGSNAFTLVGKGGSGRRSAGFIVAQALQSAFPTQAIVQHTFSRRSDTSERDEWQSLLVSLDPQSPKDQLTGLQHRCAVMAANHVRRVGGNGAILLLLNNFERITKEAATTLLDFGEILASRGYKLRLFSIAEHSDFTKRFANGMFSLRPNEVNTLVGKPYILDPIDPALDLPQVLEEIDDGEYPSGSGCSWTQFFLPRAYEAGLRLKNCAPDIVDAVAQLEKDLDIKPTTRQIFTAIRSVLGQASLVDADNLRLAKELWFDALDRAAMSSVDRIKQSLSSAE